jgi:peroxiredoxin
MSAETRTTALKVKVGEMIPSVGLRASDGYLLNLRSFIGKQAVAYLFFAAPTAEGAQRRRGTRLAEAFAAAQQRLQAAGIAVIGVSCDSEAQQAAWIAEHRIPYLLFSDERRSALDLLGIPVTVEDGNFNVARPVVIVVNDAGRIVTILEDPDPEFAADIVLAAVRRAAEGGEAIWHEHPEEAGETDSPVGTASP